MLKSPRSPFDALRANGQTVELAINAPFVLRLSKHENAFFSSLLARFDATSFGPPKLLPRALQKIRRSFSYVLVGIGLGPAK